MDQESMDLGIEIGRGTLVDATVNKESVTDDKLEVYVTLPVWWVNWKIKDYSIKDVDVFFQIPKLLHDTIGEISPELDATLTELGTSVSKEVLLIIRFDPKPKLSEKISIELRARGVLRPRKYRAGRGLQRPFAAGG